MRLYFIIDNVSLMLHAHLTVFNYLIQFRMIRSTEIMNITLTQSIVLGDKDNFILVHKNFTILSLNKFAVGSEKQYF